MDGRIFIRIYIKCVINGSVPQDQKNSDIVKLPSKGKYRQRAHSNPLVDVHFDVPTKPSDVDWCVYLSMCLYPGVLNDVSEYS